MEQRDQQCQVQPATWSYRYADAVFIGPRAKDTAQSCPECGSSICMVRAELSMFEPLDLGQQKLRPHARSESFGHLGLELAH